MSDSIEAKSFAAELGAKMPELDLHEKMSLFNEEDVRGFVLENYHLDKEMVRIIYGIGEGILRKKVLELLKIPELQSVIARVDEKIGSCIIIFKEDI
ncbi:MAG: Smr/MutS family protein [Patescibacteria group bacterium]